MLKLRVGIAKQMGATEVHIVGGFHPKLPLEYYEDMMRAIKKSDTYFLRLKNISAIKHQSIDCCRNLLFIK